MVTAAPILMDSRTSAPSPRPTSAPVPVALAPGEKPAPAGVVLIDVEHLDFFYGSSQALHDIAQHHVKVPRHFGEILLKDFVFLPFQRLKKAAGT